MAVHFTDPIGVFFIVKQQWGQLLRRHA